MCNFVVLALAITLWTTTEARADRIDDLNSSWVGGALRSQRRIDLDTPISDTSLIGAHNSFNSEAYASNLRYLDPNQQESTFNQLRMGARAVEFDVHWTTKLEGWGLSNRLLLCHGTASHVGCNINDRTFEEGLDEIAAWLGTADSIGQVLVLHLEDHMDGHNGEAFARVTERLGNRIYFSGGCTDIPASLTKAQVLGAGKQVVIWNEGPCSGDGDWNSMVFTGLGAITRVWEDSTSLGGGSIPPIGPTEVANLHASGINIVDLDQLNPDDSRWAAAVWSWNGGEPNDLGGEDCAAQVSPGRWNDADCRLEKAFACENLSNGSWAITALRKSFGYGALACRRLGPDYRFSLPTNSQDNQLLNAARVSAGQESVWINYEDRAVEGNWQSRNTSNIFWDRGGLTLNPGESVSGSSRLLRMEPNCNLVLYGLDGDTVGGSLWKSGTANLGTNCRAQFQTDGFLGIRDGTGHLLWSSGAAASELNLQADGNLVLYDDGGISRWATSTNVAEEVTLEAGSFTLTPGQHIQTRRLKLAMTADGNLVLSSVENAFVGGVLWRSNTSGSGSRAVFQTDGNLVIYDGGGNARWAAGTSGTVNAQLRLQADGNVVIYNGQGEPLWSTLTNTPDQIVVHAGQFALGRGQWIQTRTRKLALSESCDLVVSSVENALVGAVLWHTGTTAANCRADFQADGNFVIYDGGGQAIWAAGTSGTAGAELRIQMDGNVVLYNGNNQPLWTAQTRFPTESSFLAGQFSLAPGQFVRQRNRLLELREDCELVLYTVANGARGLRLWRTDTAGNGTQCRLDFQADGNLVLYNGAGRPLWWTGTSGTQDAAFRIQSDGNMVIYNGSGQPLWTSQTPGNFSEVATCGDATCNGTENCDSCSSDCGSCPLNCSCGDGILKTECGEQCDDGGRSFGDGCDETCRLELCTMGSLPGCIDIGQNEFQRITKAQTPTLLYVIPTAPLNNAERTMLASLMGIVSRKSNEQIYLDPNGGAYSTWLQDLVERHGVGTVSVQDPWWLVDHFAPQISGYLIYDTGNSSINAATSMAGVADAIVVEESIEWIATAHGLPRVLDVRGRDEAWVKARYGDHLNPFMAIEQRETLDVSLRDYAVLSRALTFFDGNSAFRNEVVDQLTADGFTMGWGDASGGEDVFVGASSDRGVFTVAADHAYNLAPLSGIPTRSMHQPDRTKVTAEPGVHYAAFLMTDGDNVQWILNNFITDSRWFGSPLRGTFDMGWGMPPSLAFLAPSVMEWLYDHAASGPRRDSFSAGPSGSGYMFPSRYPRTDLATHVDGLVGWMSTGDLKTVQILDVSSLRDTKLWDVYTNHPQIEGLLYLDYADYAKEAGAVVWSNSKPVISARTKLWTGLPNSDTASVRNVLNTGQRDPTSTSGYSLVSVSAWADSLDTVKAVIDGLSPSVRIVTPETLVQLMSDNVPREVLFHHDYVGADFGTSDLLLNGTAIWISDPAPLFSPYPLRLRLTSNGTGQQGSAWYSTRIDPTQSWSTSYRFQISFPVAGGADGIGFVLQRVGTDAIPNHDGKGLPEQTFAVSIDTWNNDEGTDQSLKVILGGNVLYFNDLSDFATDPTPGSSPTVFRMEIDYVAQTRELNLRLYDEGSANALYYTVKNVDLSGFGPAWAGFAANTGGSAENHDIRSWSLAAASGEPPTPTTVPTLTPIPTATGTPSATPSPSETSTSPPSASPTDAPTASPTATVSPTASPTATVSPTASPTGTGTNTPTPSASTVATGLPTPTGTETTASTPTLTQGPGEAPTPSPTESGSPLATASATPELVCPATPLTGCKRPVFPGKSRLTVLVRDVTPQRVSLTWRWKKGPEVSAGEVGDPAIDGTTTFAFCVYDNSNVLLYEATLPPGPNWSSRRLQRTYRDASLSQEGVRTLGLTLGSAGRAVLSALNRNGPIPLQPPPYDRLPVRVQLSNSLQTCWEAEYAAPTKNDVHRFWASGQ